MPSFTVARVPLRTKLVVAVLALLAAALVAIGVTSSIALRSYLIGRIDQQLRLYSHKIDVGTIPRAQSHGFVPPTSWLVGIVDVHAVGNLYKDPSLSQADLPPLPQTLGEAKALVGKVYTVSAVDGSLDWRMLVTEQPNGDHLVLGQSLTDVEGAVHRLVMVELIVGGITLVIMTAVGVAAIRASLRPLTEMEATAAAIAAGDLTRRVPEYEPGADPPRTEVGTLGRTLNTMLGEIELAFAARQRSEAAAQQAAETARRSATAASDAASAAQRSEIRARRSEERMRQFAADASHELRTPLTTIRGFAELYRQGAASTPDDAARLVRRIEDEASRMGMLVEDLLLLARLDQERPLEREPVDLRIIGADAMVNAQAAAPDRTIDLDIAPNTGRLIVLGDDLRLRQVVGNLMTNALTHTPAGTPVTLRLAADGEMAELSVIDRGPGLAEDQISRVFERFYRVDTARTRRPDEVGPPRSGSGTGTGLGLPIVGALVTAHGGTVEVASSGAPGSGAIFRVRLPLAHVDSEDDLSDMGEIDEPAVSSGG